MPPSGTQPAASEWKGSGGQTDGRQQNRSSQQYISGTNKLAHKKYHENRSKEKR